MVTVNQRAIGLPRRSLEPTQGAADVLPSKLPQIKLRYGQVLWLLTELGCGDAVSGNAFHEYMRSLRKIGIPFGHERFQTKHRRRLAEHSYCHVMELAVALSLRVYHVVPDSILHGVIRYRRQLHRLYRRAYALRRSGLGSPILIKTGTDKPIELRGLFLDLGIRFSGGQLVRFGPPKLLSPCEALRRFSCGTGPFLPISLSFLSERLVELAQRAPGIHSGPRGSAAKRRPVALPGKDRGKRLRSHRHNLRVGA
jgi:hypothetical protein